MHRLFLLLITANLIFPGCSVIWNDLFLNADPTFVYTPNFYVHSNYRAVIDVNPYTPLRHIVLSRTLSELQYRNGTNIWKPYKYSDKEKSAQRKVIFLPLHVTMGYSLASIRLNCEALIHVADRILRQEFIFAQISRPVDVACLVRHVQYLGKSKLVVFESTRTHTLLIPCLTCKPIIFSQLVKSFRGKASSKFGMLGI